MFSSILGALCCLVTFTLADKGPLQDTAYDDGQFGNYPVETFASSPILAPRINFVTKSTQCSDSYVFMSPRGYQVQQPGPMILDSDGTLIWGNPDYGLVYNIKAQDYKGQTYLTFWAGDDGIRGHGTGTYFMLDQSYNQVREIVPANGLPGDLHEFLITQNDTAIITIYQNLAVDFTPDGPDETLGYIWDCLFQELDLETGEAVFQWRASDHLGFADSSRGFGSHYTPDDAMDWFHINSVDKDDVGNYLVSARYTRSAMYVDGNTGEIIWMLGGKRNNFKDLSDGKATAFVGQHDARWSDNFTSVTLFDNAKDWDYTGADTSRGVRVALDYDAMTATLRTEYDNPTKILSSSQGNMQVLPNGNVLLGYGFNGAFTEFSANGDVLCEAHFEAGNRWDSGDAQSYRITKYAWKGLPTSPPDFTVGDEVGYVSWNGATEVTAWRLQSAMVPDANDTEFKNVRDIKRGGFETAIALTSSDVGGGFVRIQGLDQNGEVLGTSRTLSVEASNTIRPNLYDRSSLLIWAALALLLVVASFFGIRRFMAWRRSEAQGYSRLDTSG